MRMDLLYRIRLPIEEFAELLDILPSPFSLAVYATTEGSSYLIDASTKAIFDEHDLAYELEDVCPRQAAAPMCLKFYKKGHRRGVQLANPPVADEAA